MRKTKPHQQHASAKWNLIAAVLRMTVLLAIVSCLNSQQTFAQQSAPIEPCKDTPANGKTLLKRIEASPAKDAIKKVETTQTLIDESIPGDPELEKLIAPYSAKVRELAVVIGQLEGELKKERIGAGSLGNFVTDGLRAQAARKLGAPVQVMITNAGGLRKNTIAPGELRASDIFELLPFENALIKLDFTGAQLLKLLGVVLKGRDAQSGARIKYRLNAENNPEFISAALVDANGQEVEIDPHKTYGVVTIDYLLSLKSGDFAILQEGQNVTPLGLTMREAIMDYVKSETAGGRPIKAGDDGRFVLVESAEKAKSEARPE